MNRLPLRSELFLITHTETGKPLVHVPSLAAGLAGALLIDLTLARFANNVDGRLVVYGWQPTGDALTDWAAAAIRNSRTAREPRDWVKWLAPQVYDRVRGELVANGVLQRTTRRRLGLVPVERYAPAESMVVTHIRAAVRQAAHGAEWPDPQGGALCSLVRIMRIENELYLDLPARQLLRRLDEITAHQPPAVRAILTAIDSAIGDAAVSVYR